MGHLIYNLARLAAIDQNLDELQEEYGDLPEKVKEAGDLMKKRKAIVEETEEIISSIRKFCSSTKLTLVELKDKEEKLSKKQFQVRNNKEFDAITKEIANLKKEHEKLSDQLRTEGIKEENLKRILITQQAEHYEAKARFTDINAEFEMISSDQNSELKELNKAREEAVAVIDKHDLDIYERIRKFHKDSAVRIRKNSCSGCYSSIPPQKIVEIRNNLDHLYYCENCGRILIPEEE